MVESISSESSPGKASTFAGYDSDALDAVTRSIIEVEQVFKREFDLDIYLSWGTLLGAVRDGDYIGFDNDVDIAYLTRRESDFEITEEHELIVRVLRGLGYPVQRNSKGQIHVRVQPEDQDMSGAIFNLDLWTTFTRDGRYYHYPDIKGEIAADDVLPLQRFSFRGFEVLIPVGYEHILNCFYGDGWREPDPNYAWYPRYDADDEFEFLRSKPGSAALTEYPKKAEDLNVVEKDGFFFINGPDLAEEQRLNASGMVILELCNGQNTIREIIECVQQAFELSSAPEVAVLEFLSNALSNGLVRR